MTKLNQQNKLGLSAKAIQESIGKASAATRLSLGEGSVKLAEAAFQAKRLGVEIEKLNQIGSSLLDFESSISSEMEAGNALAALGNIHDGDCHIIK